MRFDECRRLGAIGGFALLCLALVAGTSGRAFGYELSRAGSRSAVVREFAQTFVKNQGMGGDFQVGPRVQTHLKTDIALALVADALHDPRFARSARRDLDWIIRNRLEPGGGLNWDGPQNPFFFEVHQHWYLIASELIRVELDLPADYHDTQRETWFFLRGTNPGQADFYLDNQARTGPFFAWRDVRRDGVFQQQAPFKGSYEIGAALWSMALHRDTPWVDAPGAVSSYLTRLVAQTAKPPEQQGWYAPNDGGWIRLLGWNADHWEGYTPHDWKYALHLQEGALLYQILTGGTELEAPIRQELTTLLHQIQPRGEILGMPDGYGNIVYEYGEALSVLGLAVECFRDSDPALAAEALDKGRRVFDYCAQYFVGYPNEDGAVLLLGLARMYNALPDTDTPGSGARSRSLAGASLDISRIANPTALSISPNPSAGRVHLEFRVEPDAEGRIEIYDVAGRLQADLRAKSGAGGSGALWWDAVDADGRPLSPGRYFALLRSRGVRTTRTFSVVR